MPYRLTMLRATLVARSMSLLAPVVTSLKIISSATRPPIITESMSPNWFLVHKYRSSSGKRAVCPPILPRDTIDILCTRSA